MSTPATSNPQARFTSLDYALVWVRDAEFYQTRQSLLTSGVKGKTGGGIPGITNVQNRQSSYSVTAYARKGVYGPGLDSIAQTPGGSSDLPGGLGLFSATVPYPNGVSQVDPQTVGGLGGLTGQDRVYVLRIVNPPENAPQTDLTSDSGATPGLLTPRPYALPRSSSGLSLSISGWMIDNIMSAIPGTGAEPNGTWVESYIAAWESLATTHPMLGRKPSLGMKFANRYYGIGQTALYLESVGVQRTFYERGVTASATLDLRFTEVIH